MNVIHRVWPICAAGLMVCCSTLRGAEDLALPTAAPRAQVVAVENPRATDAFQPRPDVVTAMVNEGITRLTGKPTVWYHLNKKGQKRRFTRNPLGTQIENLTPGPYL